MKIINTTEEFRENILDIRTEEVKTDRPTLVDFYASWCAPCKSLGEVLLNLPIDVLAKVDIVKIDVEPSETQELANFFKIRSIPFLVFIDKNGIETHSGSMTKEKLIEKFESKSWI